MKSALRSLLLVFMAFTANAATNITTPSVSGNWTLAGSPYLIYNSINVAPCDILTIEPGVEVVFQGYYSLNVAGSLIAAGTDDRPILFHVSDTTGWNNVLDTAGGWKGITWSPYTCSTTADASIFSHCDVSDVKALDVISGYRDTFLGYCSFHHNIGSFRFPTTPSFEMSYCSVYNSTDYISTSTSGSTVYYNGTNLLQFGTIYGGNSGSVNIHDCDFYGNSLNTSCINVNHTTLMFNHNNVHDNTATDRDFSTGTIYLRKSTCTVIANRIYNNTDGEDAAIHEFSCDIVIDRNYICNNQSINGMATNYYCGAGQGGGAIRLHNDVDSNGYHAIVRNNIIANNFSGFGGGAIYVLNANAEITNNQIVNNSAARGGGVTFNNYPSVNHTKGVLKNNLFYHNISIDYVTTGSGHPTVGSIDTTDVFSDYADTLIFEHNWVAMPVYHALGLGSVSISPTLLLIGDTTNNLIGTDPGLVAPTLTPSLLESALAADFNVQPTSVTINKGTTAGITPSAVDYLQNLRVYGSAIDIGAYEYSRPLVGTPLVVSKDNSMVVYPNPATNKLHISTPVAIGSLQLYDITGKQVTAQAITNANTAIDIRTFPAGTYVVSWTNGGTSQVQKVVIE